MYNEKQRIKNEQMYKVLKNKETTTMIIIHSGRMEEKCPTINTHPHDIFFIVSFFLGVVIQPYASNGYTI